MLNFRFKKVVSLAVLTFFLFSDFAIGAIVKDTLRPNMAFDDKGAAVRGADRGYVTKVEHDIIRDWLNNWYNENRKELSKYRVTYLETQLAGDFKIYRIHGFKEALKKLGVPDVSGHWALIKGIIYIDEDVYYSPDGYRILLEEICELMLAREFADEKGWSYGELAEWLDGDKDVIVVEDFLWKNHIRAQRAFIIGDKSIPALKKFRLLWDTLDGPERIMPNVTQLNELNKNIRQTEEEIEADTILRTILVRIKNKNLHFERRKYDTYEKYLDAITNDMIREGELSFLEKGKLKAKVYDLYPFYFMGRNDTKSKDIDEVIDLLINSINQENKALISMKGERYNLLRPVRGAATGYNESRRDLFKAIITATGLSFLLGCGDKVKELPLEVQNFNYSVDISFPNYVDTNFQWGVKFPPNSMLKIEVTQRAKEPVCYIGQVFLKVESWDGRSYTYSKPIEIKYGVIEIPTNLMPDDLGNIKIISLYYFPPGRISTMDEKILDIVNKYNATKFDDRIDAEVEWIKLNFNFTKEHGNPLDGSICPTRAWIEPNKANNKATQQSI